MTNARIQSLSNHVSRHSAALLVWLVPAWMMAYAICNIGRIDADSLGQFRYAQDVALQLSSDVPIAWIMQEGPRYFPDFLVSLFAYLIGLGSPASWAIIFALSNMCLLYAAVNYLLRGYGLAESQSRLVACLFQLGCLGCAAVSPYFARELLLPTHHNILLPLAMIFYAAPLICARQSGLAVLAKFTIFGVLFGICLHADTLLLIWIMVPMWLSLLILRLIPMCSLCSFSFCSLLIGVALIVSTVMEIVLGSFTFVDIQSTPVLQQLPGSVEAMQERFAELLRDAYSTQGASALIVVQITASTLCAAVIWQACRSKIRPQHDLSITISTLYFVTTLVIPFILVAADRLSQRYLFFLFAFAVLAVAVNLYTLLARSQLIHTRVRWLPVALLAALILPASAYNALNSTPRFPELVKTLERLRNDGQIGEQGLANFWVAHQLAAGTPFEVMPLDEKALPNLHTYNAYRYWEWKEGCPGQRPFTFAITAKKRNHSVTPFAMMRIFGRPAGTAPVAGPGGYEVWLYPQGIRGVARLYGEVKAEAQRKGLSMTALERCKT